MCEICSKFTIKTPERRHDVITNSTYFFVLPLLPLNKLIPACHAISFQRRGNSQNYVTRSRLRRMLLEGIVEVRKMYCLSTKEKWGRDILTSVAMQCQEINFENMTVPVVRQSSEDNLVQCNTWIPFTLMSCPCHFYHPYKLALSTVVPAEFRRSHSQMSYRITFS